MDLSNEYVAKSFTRQLLTAALRILSDTVKVHRWLGRSEVHSCLADVGSLGLLVCHLLLLSRLRESPVVLRQGCLMNKRMGPTGHIQTTVPEEINSWRLLVAESTPGSGGRPFLQLPFPPLPLPGASPFCSGASFWARPLPWLWPLPLPWPPLLPCASVSLPCSFSQLPFGAFGGSPCWCA